MAQHFLLSAEARDLSLMKLFNMSENEAFVKSNMFGSFAIYL